jgi:hypothetical protein
LLAPSTSGGLKDVWIRRAVVAVLADEQHVLLGVAFAIDPVLRGPPMKEFLE